MALATLAALPLAEVPERSALLPVSDQLEIEPVAGRGVWLETADGRRLLDFYGGHAVALLGYRHPACFQPRVDVDGHHPSCSKSPTN